MDKYRHLVFRDRKNTDCMKWDGLEKEFGRDDLLAAWVADMDIESPECVKRALLEYVNFNVYGYYRKPEAYNQAFIRWMKKYHGYEIKEEWVRFAPGVVPAIYWIIQMLTDIEDSVAIMTPVYYPFSNAIRDTARTEVDIPLIRGEDHRYYIDYDLFEEQAQRKKIRVLIFCSPHNPVGRVWTEEELKRLLDICRKYNIFVISDEIHHDIVIGDNKHITAATLGNYDSILITLTSASKTFNLAGCQNAMVILPNHALRSKYDAFTRKVRIGSGNNFSYVAYRAAFEKGREWLDELLQLIEDNYHLMCKCLEKNLPKAVVTPLEGTYLTWIDLSAYLEGHDTERVIRDTCQLAVDFGEWFGGEEYADFIRLNLATSPDNVKKMMIRLNRINDL